MLKVSAKHWGKRAEYLGVDSHWVYRGAARAHGQGLSKPQSNLDKHFIRFVAEEIEAANIVVWL